MLSKWAANESWGWTWNARYSRDNVMNNFSCENTCCQRRANTRRAWQMALITPELHYCRHGDIWTIIVYNRYLRRSIQIILFTLQYLVLNLYFLRNIFLFLINYEFCVKTAVLYFLKHIKQMKTVITWFWCCYGSRQVPE